MHRRMAWAVSVAPVLVADGLVSGWPAVIEVAIVPWTDPLGDLDWPLLMATWALAHAVAVFLAPRPAGVWMGALFGHSGGAAWFVLTVLPGEHPVAGLFLVVAVYGLGSALLGCALGSFVLGWRRPRGRGQEEPGSPTPSQTL